jgi:hypothetical protein
VADNEDVPAECYEQAPDYQQHLEEVMASYEHPKGLLGELVGQLADAFWWIKVYRRDKDNLIVSHMASPLVKRRSYVEQDQQLWLSTFRGAVRVFRRCST